MARLSGFEAQKGIVMVTNLAEKTIVSRSVSTCWASPNSLCWPLAFSYEGRMNPAL